MNVVEVIQTDLLSAETALSLLERGTSPSGVAYARLGKLARPYTSPAELLRLTGAVPAGVAKTLAGVTYAFVPLAFSAARLRDDDAAIGANDQTLVAQVATPALVDRATCHRNSNVNGEEVVFLSAELHNDSFALAFEFFINVAHDFVDKAGVPASFTTLLEQQMSTGVRGETSVDAWEHRVHGYGAVAGAGDEPPARNRSAVRRPSQEPVEERTAHAHAAFADAVAIYMLSLYLDLDYADLREREYPLLAPPALAARLRAVNALFPVNDGYAFNILYRRRT